MTLDTRNKTPNVAMLLGILSLPLCRGVYRLHSLNPRRGDHPPAHPEHAQKVIAQTVFLETGSTPSPFKAGRRDAAAAAVKIAVLPPLPSFPAPMQLGGNSGGFQLVGRPCHASSEMNERETKTTLAAAAAWINTEQLSASSDATPPSSSSSSLSVDFRDIIINRI